tara:strand:- start:4665 stop:5687 length:1023 start_codon:yes stop_codon:yes gene_type:complete
MKKSLKFVLLVIVCLIVSVYSVAAGGGSGRTAIKSTGEGGDNGEDSRPSCVGNQGAACGNCGTIACGGSCTGQGACSSGSTQCSGSIYQTCSSSCAWSNTGTNADNDAMDAECGDSLCDNSPDVFDSTKTSTESSLCSDNLDNDCDTSTDCQDQDCDSTLQGTITDSKNNALDELAQVEIKDQNLQTVATAYTDVLGNYATTIACGEYKLIASREDYVPATSSITLPAETTITENFQLTYGQVCESDCTYTGDDIVHKECNDINGCSFYDETAREACNYAKPGWIKKYSETHEVECPDKIPREKVMAKATVSCEEENLIKMTRLVNYQGRLVKMIVIVCG